MATDANSEVVFQNLTNSPLYKIVLLKNIQRYKVWQNSELLSKIEVLTEA